MIYYAALAEGDGPAAIYKLKFDSRWSPRIMSQVSPPKKIMLLDDDPFIIGVMKGFLNSPAFQIDCATSVLEALELTKHKDFDCIVSDVRLPIGTGADLLTSLREINRRSPAIIFVSGFSDITVDELLFRGADSFLLKPFTQEVFVAEVNRLAQPLPLRQQAKPASYESLKPITLNASNVLKTGTGGDVRLGLGGFFARIHPEGVRINQHLRFTLEIGKGEVLQGCGRIMWLRRPSSLRPLAAGMGLLIEYLEPKSNEAYQAFIDKSDLLETIPREIVP